ncbi:MAG: NAD-dependent deacetylase [Lentisphaerae bacterium]|nr:NAD-dependent deacetylase [Lentisphaerota bacterium]
MSKSIESFYEALAGADKVMVLTGAGISTLSGIPDFRGAMGCYQNKWHGMEVEEILSLPCFKKHPEYFYEWAQTFVYGVGDYEPNIVHKTLAAWEQRNLICRTYTQNIDILHQHAGSRRLYELHGSPAHHHCMQCGEYFDYDFVAPLVHAGTLPRCSQCGGVIKPDIVFYGENLNRELLEQAFNDFASADLALVLGSSLTVNPAAVLPQYTLRSGGKLAIVNMQPTNLDRFASWKFDDLRLTFEELARLTSL